MSIAHVTALLLVLASVGCMSLAIVGMVTGRPGGALGVGSSSARGRVLRGRGGAQRRRPLTALPLDEAPAWDGAQLSGCHELSTQSPS